MVTNHLSILAVSNNDEVIIENEDDFLYDIGYEDNDIDEFYGENQSDYQVIQPRFAPIIGLIVRTVIINGVKVTKHLYKSIKYAPKYPSGFKAVQNGTIKNKSLLDELRQIESGTWKKVYKDRYDKNNENISIHYFQSKSGLVYEC